MHSMHGTFGEPSKRAFWTGMDKAVGYLTVRKGWHAVVWDLGLTFGYFGSFLPIPGLSGYMQ